MSAHIYDRSRGDSIFFGPMPDGVVSLACRLTGVSVWTVGDDQGRNLWARRAAHDNTGNATEIIGFVCAEWVAEVANSPEVTQLLADEARERLIQAAMDAPGWAMDQPGRENYETLDDDTLRRLARENCAAWAKE
jgi:hypothetical protein